MAIIKPAATSQTDPYVRNQLYTLPLSELQPDPGQSRKYLDPQALDELTASVAQHGILEPVIFRRDKTTGLLYVVAGERRCEAARKAGLASVPAVFLDSDNYAEIALVENLLRQDLNPIEESEALKRLMEEHAYKQEDLARIIGRSPATISESLSLSKLPQEIRDECRQDPAVPKNVLVGIARNKQERTMLKEYKKYREQQALVGFRKTPTAKRTKAEALANTIGTTDRKIATLDFQELTEGDWPMIIAALTALKSTVDETLAKFPESEQNAA